MLDDYKTENIETNSTDVEKQQEMILINKLQAQGKNPPKSQSTFLQKKLQQRKFFDSGDYAMNQDKEKKHQRPSAIPAALGGGKKAPLPESAKQPTSGTISSHSHSTTSSSSSSTTPAAPPSSSVTPPTVTPATTITTSPTSDDDEEEHLQIPRPDTVPQRKASILHPSAHSKLSPQPLIHHEHTDELLSSPQN
uniref:cAMP-regulated phosphoprotein 19 n=1 Tax=Panagrolaimus superbus TaxID=310955 RepID=A0A914YQL4_9BILA